MIRTWQDVENLDPPLNAAERKLVEACKAGRLCKLGDGKRPEGEDSAREIRADLLRYLILGGCDGCRVHEWGVFLAGAWVSGGLDLSFATAKGATGLLNCRFEHEISALQARFELLNLAGSFVPGLNAQGATVSGDLFLREGFEANGEVNLSGAEIGGQLSCEGGKFSNETGRALNGQRMRVGQGFFWRGVSVKEGRVILTSAYVGDLVDDLDSWPKGENRLYLDGFTYERVTASFTDTGDRLEWLARGTVWKGEFFPQPYSQLARVFREMGHLRGARKVMLVQRQRVAYHDWKRAHRALDGTWRAGFRSVAADVVIFFSGLSRLVVGYGYAPFRSLGALVLLWAAAALLGCLAWHSGAMVPNSAVMLTAPGWLAVETAPNAALEWSLHDPSGRDWETFNALIWGFDVVVPLVEVGQTEAWAPSSARGVAGSAAWWGRWLLATAGWVVAALAVAAFTGIIRRDDE